MSALASITNAIPAAPRGAGPSYWTRLRGEAVESLVSIDHIAGSPPRATVTVLSGPREGEVIPLPPGTALREDTGAFTELEPGFPWFADGA